ncbi:MAG: XRE family transcriptional regulator [Coprococcus sp.]|mgnify:FL=1|nr:XRE family transcriptional regulator [Coprococcus sp.]
MKCNVRVRKELETRRIRQWELAKELGIDEGTLCRRLRVELPEEEQDRLISIIQDIQKEGV